MSKETLKEEIDLNINTNGLQKITGVKLNNVLNDIVDEMAIGGGLIEEGNTQAVSGGEVFEWGKTKADIIKTEGKNKFNPSEVQLRKWLNGSGQIANEPSDNFILSDFIDADEFNYLSRPYLYTYFAVAYYGEDKTTIYQPQDVNGNNLPFEVGNQKSLALKRPNGAKYIIFTVAFGDPNEESQNIQLEKGQVFTGHEPYTEPVKEIDPSIMGNYIKKSDIENNTITIQNSDKIAWYGCSYTESFYSLEHKSWINKLSNIIDLPLGNFAVSGNTMIELNNKIKNNYNPFHSTVGIKEYQPSHVIMANIGNETTHIFGNYADMYLNEVKESVSLIKSLGAKPIIGTDWCIENHGVDALISQYSIDNNIPYYGIGSVVEQVSKIKFDNFWFGHPGIRTNAPIWLSWFPFINKIKPKKSIKIFRPRNNDAPIESLNFDTNLDRVKMWQEINVGEWALNNGTSEQYYDKLWDRDAYSASPRTNEYCKIIAKENVSFNKKSLIEIIVPNVKSRNIVKIKSDTLGLTFYAKNTLNTAFKYDDVVGQALMRVEKSVYDLFASETVNQVYIISEKPSLTFQYKGRIKSDALGGYFLSFKSSATYEFPSLDVAGTLTRQSDNRISNYLGTSPLSKYSYGAYTTIMGYSGYFEAISSTYENGYYTLDISNYSFLDYDKLRVIVNHIGQFNISDVECECLGGNEKISDNKFISNESINPELLTPITSFGSASYNNSYELTSGATWKQLGVVNQYPSYNADNSFVELGYNSDGFPAKMKRSFVVDKTRNYRELIVKVTARVHPKVYDLSMAEDDNFTHTPQVGKTSFDYATLCAGVQVDGSFPFTTMYTDEPPYSISRSYVDLSWSEIEFKFLISPYSENVNFMIWRDENDLNKIFPLQVCDIEVSLK